MLTAIFGILLLTNFVSANPVSNDDDIYQDLLTQPGSDDDEDYYNPLQSLLPPKVSAPSSVSPNGTDWTDFGTSGNASELLNGVMNMVNGSLTPSANGAIPLTSLLTSAFGVNGSQPSTSSLFMPGGLLNPMTYMNGSSAFNSSTLANINPFSNWQNIISALNSTGIFGNLSGVSALTQNLSSIMTQVMNNSTNNANIFGQMMSDFQNMWSDVSSAIKPFFNWQNMFPTSNSTGMFGNLSGLPALAQNLSSIMTQVMNNGTNNVNLFGQMVSDFQNMWNDLNSTVIPFSNWQNGFPASNSSGLFANLSGLPALAQNLSSIMTQVMNNGTTNMNLFGQIMRNSQNIWNGINSALQSFMSTVALMPPVSNSLSHSLLPQSNPGVVSQNAPLGAIMGTSSPSTEDGGNTQ